MRIYKYRAIDARDDAAFARLARIVGGRLVWCARPDTLNDPHEFAWTCDFTPSSRTLGILTALLQKTKGHSPEEASRRAQLVLQSGDLESLCRPVIETMIKKTRDEIGVACFGSAPDNPVLWARYSGEGTGVAVEFDVPVSTLGTQLHRVIYDDNRRIHIDDFLRSVDERDAATGVYATLLTKTKYWEPEAEIRFISDRQQVEVRLDNSTVTRVLVGPRVTAELEATVAKVAGDVPVVRVTTDGLTSACSRRPHGRIMGRG